MAVLVS